MPKKVLELNNKNIFDDALNPQTNGLAKNENIRTVEKFSNAEASGLVNNGVLNFATNDIAKG